MGGVAVEQGHRRQKQGCCCRKLGTAGVGNAAGPGLGGGGVLEVQSKRGRSRVLAAAYYSTREKGTCLLYTSDAADDWLVV